MLVAIILWGALLLSGRATPVQVAGSVAAGILLWSFSFAVGFGAFSSGMQSNGLGALLTLGLPMIAAGLMRTSQPALAALVPPGAVYTALVEPPTWLWLLGPLLTALATMWLTRRVVGRCEGNLRDWYERNQGTRPAAA